MRSKWNHHRAVMKRCLLTGFVACSALTIAPATWAKKKEPAPPPECPVDTTLRTADPNLLKRFTVLAGCEDNLLVAPASELDYVEPDGRIIVAENTDGDADAADDSDDEDYSLQYADIKPSLGAKASAKPALDSKSMPKSRKAEMQDDEKKGRYEIYAYDNSAAQKSLAGTGTVVRIVPEQVPADPLAGYAPGFQNPAAGQSGPIAGSGILAMRPHSYRTQFDEIIAQTANTHRIDPLLLHAVIQQESNYRYSATSQVGAKGLMQIMPGTGRLLGVHPAHLNDPAINVDAGARLLRKLYFKYDGNFDLILAAYNAGEGAVQKYGNRVPPYRETQNYVKMVMQRYNKLLAEQGAMAPR